MSVKIIVAYNMHRIIGVNGDLPWKIKDDMQHFKEETTGHVCIMGRKTWESIPPKYRPLPDRVNIILTRFAEGYTASHTNLTNMQETHVCGDLFNAIELAKYLYPDRDIFITGGSEIYRQAIESNVVDEIIASEVKGYEDIKEGVTFPILPYYSKNWSGEHIKSRPEFDVWRYSRITE